MKQIPCPLHGLRPVAEFIYGGIYRSMPDPKSVDHLTWGDYVFHRHSLPGIQTEWWCHLPSQTWILVERDTLTDTILRTYLPSAPP